MVAGVALAITFFGVAVLALSVRSARGVGRLDPVLGPRCHAGEHIDEPEPFVGKSGFLGWLQSSLRDRVGSRCGLPGPQSPLDPAWVLRGLQPVVGESVVCLIFPFYGIRCPQPPVFGIERGLFFRSREQPARLLPCRGRRGVWQARSSCWRHRG